MRAVVPVTLMFAVVAVTVMGDVVDVTLMCSVVAVTGRRAVAAVTRMRSLFVNGKRSVSAVLSVTVVGRRSGVPGLVSVVHDISHRSFASIPLWGIPVTR